MKKSSLPAVERWRSRVDQQRSSGLSIVAFCRRHGLALATFHFWKRRLLQQHNSPAFVEVQVTAEPNVVGGIRASAAEPGRLELRLRRGIRLRVGRGFDRQLLLELIDALEPRA